MQTRETVQSNFISDISFSQLPKHPGSTSEGLWLVSMAVLSVCLLALREYLTFQKETSKAEKLAKLQEDKIELARMDALIKYQQELNQKLVEEVCSARQVSKCENCDLVQKIN